MRQQRGGQHFPPEPITTPATTRIGSGLSARLVAVAALVVLGGVVVVGVTSRPAPRDPASRPSFSPLAQASVAPSPAAAASPVSGTPAAARVPLGSQPLVLADDAFAVIAQVEGRTYMQVLREPVPGLLTGEFRAPFLDWDPDGYTLELAQLWTRDVERRNYAVVGRWHVDLRPLVAENVAGTTVLRQTVDPLLRPRRAPRLATSGYTITVRVESRGKFGMLEVEVRMGEPRRQLRGDDGLAGSLTGGEREPTATPRVAQPAVPLIVLTAAPGHPQRATRTHGESWYAGY